MRWMMLALAAAAAGCGGDDAPAEASEVEVVERAPAALRGSERMQGTWRILLTDAERRRQAVMTLAIQEPPATAEQIRAMELSPDEQTQLHLTRAALGSGDEEMIAQIRSTIENLDKATLTITADTLTMSFGEVEDVSSYVVSSENSEGVLIKARREGEPEEALDITFPAPDQLKLSNPAQPEDVMLFEAAR